MDYNVTTFTVKVDSRVAERFRTILRSERNGGTVTSWVDDQEPPLDAHKALERAVQALLEQHKLITAVALVKDYFGWGLADAKDAVLYYKDRG